MKNMHTKLRRVAAALALAVTAAAAAWPALGVHAAAVPVPAAAAQDEDAFKKLSALDFSKQAVTREQLKDLMLWDLRMLRGIVFGRHGRVFKDRDIQQYLKEQPWYKPDPGFSNSRLNQTERANLDLIRELEAELHEQIEPGDLRWWQAKPMTEEKLGTHSAAEWRILRAEVEAVRGKRFDDDPWLQQYLDRKSVV